MTRPPIQELSPQILDAASHWFVEFNEGRVEASDSEQFVQWLRVSPEHVRAYLQISSHWEDARALETTRHKASIEELIALGRREVHVLPLERDVHSLFPPGPLAELAVSAKPQNNALRFRFFAMAASVLLAACALWLYSQRNLYTTGIGEQRFVKLTDGSTIDLNSRSRIRVSYGGQHRDIELLEGQALFNVAKDATRPFVVHANQTRVTAIGTQFDVYKKATGTIVTVVEGKVAVSSVNDSASEATADTRVVVSDTRPETRPPAKVLLSAGEQMTVTRAALAPPTRADVEAATAWTEKQLIFRASPLTDVVEEFNRYNDRQMTITDPQLEVLRISGVFSSTDPDSLLRGLEAQGTFTIRETADAIEIGPIEIGPK
jgi:transmembrane sensor